MYSYFTFDQLALPAKLALFFILCGGVARLIYYISGRRKPRLISWLIDFFLPFSACIWLAFLMPIAYRGDILRMSVIPIFMGCLFFSIKSLALAKWHRNLCLMYYAAIFGLYAAIIFGLLTTTLPLILLLAVPLFGRLVQDLYEVFARPKPEREWLAELFILFSMAALLMLTLALKAI